MSGGLIELALHIIWDIGQILDVPIRYFFDDMSQDPMKSSLRRIGRGGEVINQHGDQFRDPMARRETLELVHT